MRRAILGAICFTLGAISLLSAQTTGLRPDQFVALPWTWSGIQSFGEVIGGTSIQSGTSYTLAATDCGTTINFTSGSAITVTTLNSLPIGCGIAILQAGAGQITVANGASATMNSAHSYTKTFGQWAIIGLYVDTNSGSAAHFVLTGDGA